MNLRSEMEEGIIRVSPPLDGSPALNRAVRRKSGDPAGIEVLSIGFVYFTTGSVTYEDA